MEESKNKDFSEFSMPTIIVMTKWHAINRCKSRLSKDIGALKAAKIQEKLTINTIAVAKQIQKEKLAKIIVAIDGVGISSAKRWATKNGIEKIVLQGSGNLGTKMKRQFSKTHLKKTFSNPILIIGTDLPSISRLDLLQAIEILQSKEMVLGPSIDGGYWLIGLSKKLLNPMCSWPFSGIKWGSDRVLKETIRLASSNQIDYALLQQKNDLDNLIDLSLWLDYKKFQLSASSYQL
mgnify:CR=1 FL=1|tara:strand:+ start:2268 stop:2972 length:705 start_codon:yes stop_codon:yes gene_type:complete